MTNRTMKKWWSLPVALLVGLGLGTARAQEFGPFQLEAGVLYESFANDVDQTFIGAAGLWHFKPVEDEGPLAERAFLGHVPYAGLMVGQQEIDFGFMDGDGLGYGVFGRYADTNVPVTVEAGYQFVTLDFGTFVIPFPPFPSVDVEADFSILAARVGYWVQPDLEAGLLYELFSIEDDLGIFELDETSIGAYAKTVRDIGGKMVNLEAEVKSITEEETGSPDEDNFEVMVGGDYYLETGLAVGAAIANNSGDDASEEGTTIMVRGRYDYGTMFGAQLAVGQFMASDSAVEDGTIIEFAVVYRR